MQNNKIFIVKSYTYDISENEGFHFSIEGAINKANEVMKMLDKDYRNFCKMSVTTEYTPFREIENNNGSIKLWQQGTWYVSISTSIIEP